MNFKPEEGEQRMMNSLSSIQFDEAQSPFSFCRVDAMLNECVPLVRQLPACDDLIAHCDE